MEKLKKIVILALIMCCLPISTFAENTAPVFFDVTIENGKADVKKSKPVSSTDNSELPVEVVTVTDGEPELIYKGRLGDYDNGMWNTTDFSDIQFLVILDWQNKDAPPRYIIPCAEFAESSVALTVSESSAGETVLDGILSVNAEMSLDGISIKTTGLSIISGAELCGKFYISNTDTSNRNICVILAMYTTDGKLCDAKSVSACLNTGSKNVLNLNYTIPDNSDIQKGSLLFWDSAQNMIPLRTSIDFQKSGQLLNTYYYDATNRLLRAEKSTGEVINFAYDLNGNLIQKAAESEVK